MGKWWQIFEHEITSHSEELPEAPGIYRVRLLGRGGKPVKIKRLYGTDADGILMIGSTKNLRKRSAQFIDACKGKRGHSEGTKLWMASCFRPTWFRGKKLLLEHRVEKSKEGAKCSEAEEIRDT